MKSLISTCALCFIIIVSSGQSKKELEEQILQLTGRIEKLESQVNEQVSLLTKQQSSISVLETELNSAKLSITNATATITLLNSSIQEFNKQIANNMTAISRLEKLTDSLKVMRSEALPVQDPDFITNPRNQNDSITYVLQQYYSSKRWEDRVKFVLDPDRVKPLMKEVYTNAYQSTQVPAKDFNIQGSDYKVNDRIKVIWDGYSIQMKRLVSGYFIDWEATYGYNPLSIQQLIDENRSSFTMRVFVESESNSNINDKYPESQYHRYSVRSNRGEFIEGMLFFALKSNADNQKLMNLCKDGQLHEVTLTFTEDRYDNDDFSKTFTITKVNSLSWVN